MDVTILINLEIEISWGYFLLQCTNFSYLISGSKLDKKQISDIGMMSGPSDSTLFSNILIFCSHDIPIGDSYYDPNLAVCWL